VIQIEGLALTSYRVLPVLRSASVLLAVARCLSVCLFVCLSVCLSQAGIVPKRLNGSSWFMA